MTAADLDPMAAAIAALQSQRSLLGDAAVDAAIGALRASASASAAGAAAGAPQLRQVAILFTDVVGSTALSRHLDPEEINQTMDGALARFTALVEQHQGRVLQYAGDSLLAAFGADGAHEDDAERAVLAGLAIIDEGRVQAAAIEARHGLAGFDVRVGVHSGPVLLGAGVDAEHSIRGIAVNIAARMEQTAPPGTLRISQDAYRQVRGRFELEAQPPLLVKGQEQPMQTWLVRSARREADHAATRGVDGITAPLIGRDAELARLREAFAGVHQRGEGLLHLAVVGEPGVGKSRLIAEFRQALQAWPNGIRWIEAHGAERASGRPYGVLRELLGAAVGVRTAGSAEEARGQWLAGTAGLLPRAGDAAVLGHLIGLDFGADSEVRGLSDAPRRLRDRAFFHATQLVQALATRGPALVALVDDLHWADDGTLDFFEHLFTEQPALPLLLVGLTRSTLFERRPSWAAAAGGRQRIDLAPLDAADSGHLAKLLLASVQDLPLDLVPRIVASAAGIPYFIEELINMLADRGVIVPDASGERRFLPGKLSSLTLPATLVGVLQARLDALPNDERHGLQLAAVVGYRFWDDSLRVLGARLPEALDGLRARELALPVQPSGIAGLAEHVFKHHSLHQVTYDSVLKRDKRELHAKVARWLLQHPSSAPHDLVAEHFERGGEAGLAAWHWQRAAEAAAAAYANAQALAHAARALALLPENELQARHAATRLRCQVLALTGDRAAHATELDQLHALTRTLGDAEKEADALVLRSRHLSDGGDHALALAPARQAAQVAPVTSLAQRARAHARVAQCLAMLGRAREAHAESATALALAREAGDRRTEGLVLNDQGIEANDAGNFGQALRCYELALACHREVGDRHNETGTLSNLGFVAMTLGDYEQAITRFEEARALCAGIGQRQNEGIIHVNLGMVRLNQARIGLALEHAQQALSMLRASGGRWAEAAALRLAGQALAAAGDRDAAASRLRASRDLFESLSLAHMALEPAAALADMALAEGDVAGARRAVDELLAARVRPDWLEGTEEPVRVLWICHRVLAAAGDRRAAELLDEARGRLLSYSARIAEPALRQGYLHAVPFHDAVMRA